MKIVWLPTAVAELVSSLDHIAEDSPKAAIVQSERVSHQIGQLIHHPELGRTGRKTGTRELVISHTPFIAIYRVKGQRVEIIRLLHSARHWPKPKK